ncbi:TetR/AcrR family transcriptional regulator [Metabacillus sp. GX 13764]|uniref:TetR/AcrR family transcriptional regulator n=1 Tax=Metabacillus kandeliae TaxID=2900151 RepID=UPI001E4FA86A|nr:TetR/AcrR family transcriptional regulator [Metabacillus kandeliae]MCD7035197.1 TetR/AcrR family transcriptional regulator [Metabacillus kandeliae]
MNGFERRRQTKMEQIRKTAQMLFAKYGVQKVNIQEIAKQAKVSQVTIYNYFGSKEALLLDVLKHLFEEQMTLYNDLLEKDIPFHEKIEWLIQHKMELSEAFNDDFYTYLISDQGDIKQLIIDFEANHTGPFFSKFIEQGKKAGMIQEELSFETVMFYLNMYTNEVHKHPEFFIQPGKRNQITRELLKLFFYGVAGRKR